MSAIIRAVRLRMTAKDNLLNLRMTAKDSLLNLRMTAKDSLLNLRMTVKDSLLNLRMTAKDSLLNLAADRLGHFGHKFNEADPFVLCKPLVAEILDLQRKFL